MLSGPLGAGKTALVRGLARGLGVGGRVTSPTFVIAREHRPLPGGAGVPLVHVDAYRLGTAGDVAAELDDLDLDTDLAGAVVAVEWGKGVAERSSARHLLVRLERRPDDVRIARVHRVEEVGPAGDRGGDRRPGWPARPASAPGGSSSSGASYGNPLRPPARCRAGRHGVRRAWPPTPPGPDAAAPHRTSDRRTSTGLRPLYRTAGPAG